MYRNRLLEATRLLFHHFGRISLRPRRKRTNRLQCDLHMPNKDGYQACREIRRWEKKQGWRRHPIIALSANVLGDVYAKCVEAGFNSYVTKPVEFPKLSAVLAKFLDPPDPTKAPEFMAKPRRS